MFHDGSFLVASFWRQSYVATFWTGSVRSSSGNDLRSTSSLTDGDCEQKRKDPRGE